MQIFWELPKCAFYHYLVLSCGLYLRVTEISFIGACWIVNSWVFKGWLYTIHHVRQKPGVQRKFDARQIVYRSDTQYSTYHFFHCTPKPVTHYLRSLISKCNISKNTKMELTLDSYIKFNVQSIPGVHSSQNSFLPPPKWIWIF